MYILSIWQPWECPHSPPPPRSVIDQPPFRKFINAWGWGAEGLRPSLPQAPPRGCVWWGYQGRAIPGRYSLLGGPTSVQGPLHTYTALRLPPTLLSFSPSLLVRLVFEVTAPPGFPPPPYFLSSGLSPNKNPGIFNLILAVAAQRIQTTTKCFTIFQMCKSAGIINTNT